MNQLLGAVLFVMHYGGMALMAVAVVSLAVMAVMAAWSPLAMSIVFVVGGILVYLASAIFDKLPDEPHDSD